MQRFVVEYSLCHMKSGIMSSVTLGLISAVICYATLSLNIEAAAVGNSVSKAGPPPYENDALMARYIIHNSNWISIGTISTHDAIKGYPFVTLKSVSDGPVEQSTGVPYIYLTDLELTAKDTLVNNNVTIMASLAQSGYCDDNNIDPQDPLCAKVYVSGKLVKLDKSSPEYKFAQESLFKRHPAMKNWPEWHGFYVAKIDVEQIILVDSHDGLKTVNPKEYFSAKLTAKDAK